MSKVIHQLGGKGTEKASVGVHWLSINGHFGGIEGH